ncbi:MAG: acetyl-CoA C-acyltransferase [Deltaproteobacteria bacterium]|nr:MAG: acetyl-CoA C-acyltransferase [Deltaproteobacteria bacterium]
MKEVVIIGAARTPIGRFGGSLKTLSAVDLATIAIQSAVARAGIEKEMVDMVIMGNCFDPLNQNVARIASVKCGIPVETPAFTVSATCVSAMQAIISGLHAICVGDADIVVSGGAESMSNAPYVVTNARWGQRIRHGELIDLLWRGMHEYPIPGAGMGMTAENIAAKYDISREEQDQYALLSHQRACRAIREGKFKEEIVPVEVSSQKGEVKVVDVDEHPRPDTSLEKLSKLQPAFKKDGTVTAGNSSGINDAAAAVVLASYAKARELGLVPLGKIKGYALVGVDPAYMGIGPVPATRRLLDKLSISLSQIDLIELNEAFAAQYLACERELALDRDIVNVNGSGIALGHPVGATGCRLVVTLLYEMRRRGSSLGLATLCAGGGHGYAMLIERI